MSDLPSILDAAGHRRPLGNLPYTGPAVAGPPLPRAIPESEWAEFDLVESAGVEAPKVLDQNGYGACNGFAAATALEWARWIAGLEPVPLSPWYVYAILCNGIDRGSSIAEALVLLSQRGTCPAALVPAGTINPRRLAQAAHAEAGRFRIELGARTATFAELMTATQLRKPFNFSVDAGGGMNRAGDFSQVDEEGVAGVPSGRRVGNHAVVGGLGAKRVRRGRFAGQWAIRGQNSWGPRVQDGGRFWFVADHVEGQDWFDAYTVSAAAIDPSDPTNPPGAAP